MSAVLPPSHLIAQHVSRALAEDIGPRDWTAELIPANAIGRATVVAREAAVIAGQAWFTECFRQVDPRCHVVWRVQEGEMVFADTELCTLDGPARRWR